MKKVQKEYDLLTLLDSYINDCTKGRRLQKNGKRLTTSSIGNYKYLRKLLAGFSERKQFYLRVKSLMKMPKREVDTERNYWKKFYKTFTDYLYKDLDLYDNYVGANMKLLRAFFNYLNTEKGIYTANFHRYFYAPSEDIPILVLTPERLNYLIYSKEFEASLTLKLKRIKDIVVFGCSVALRFSDLMSLKQTNLECVNQRVYLKVKSQKTKTFTLVKLPAYAIEIIERYKHTGYLLPVYDKFNLGKYMKELLEKAGFTEEVVRTRDKRGVPHVLYKNKSKETHYRYCDLVSTHTMRRTAITTMLSLGMSEQIVRKISGHAANSKEFYKYVAYAQSYVDKEMDEMFEQLKQKALHQEPVLEG